MSAADDFYGDFSLVLADDLAAFVRDEDKHRSLTVVLEAGERDLVGEARRRIDEIKADAAEVEACAAMRAVVHRWTDGSHEAQRNGVLAAVRMDERGHRGLAASLDALLSVRAKDPGGFWRMVEGAQRIVLTSPSARGDIGCRCDLVVQQLYSTVPAPVPAGEDNAVVVSLASVAPERLSWLWEGRLPRGKIVTIDGDPSVGKSTLAVDFVATVSTGKPWPDGAPCEVGNSLILSAEDGLADTIRPRLDAAGGDPTRVHALTGVRAVDDDGKVYERPPTLGDVADIRAAILRTGAVLAVIDVLMAFLPGKVDSHKDQDIRAVLSRLTKVGEETGCTFLLLRHLNKAAGGSPMYRGGGSIGIVGAARAGYLVARDPDDPETRVMACVKSNLAREPESLGYRLESAPDNPDVAHVDWTGASAHDASALLLSGAEDGDERREIDAWLLDLLDDANGSADAKDVLKRAREAGYSVDQIKRTKKRLKIESKKAGMGTGWEWVLPLEGSTKSAKSAALGVPPSSLPSTLPSADHPAGRWRVSGEPT